MCGLSALVTSNLTVWQNAGIDERKILTAAGHMGESFLLIYLSILILVCICKTTDAWVILPFLRQGQVPTSHDR